MSFALRIIIGFILIFIVEFYFYKKFKKSLTFLFPRLNEKKTGRIISVFLLIINIYPLVLLAAWIYSSITQQGRPHLPESYLFEFLILFPFWIGVLIIAQTIIFFAVLDFLRFLIYPIYKKHKEKLLPIYHKIVFAIAVFCIFYVPLRIYYDFNAVEINEITYLKENLSPDLENFKIAFISDMQADRYTNRERLQNYVDKVNSANPDLVLMAGDLITSTPRYINLAAEYAGKIDSKYGIYTCVGDHDNWAYRQDTQKSIREITSALAEVDVSMVHNDKRVINVGKSEIGITFITNTYVEKINPQTLDFLLNHSPVYDLRIFLTHQPREYLVPKVESHNYDIFLAGHTHGGQVSFLFPFTNLSLTQFETKYVRGDFWFDDMLMVVNRGLGMSLVPIRYNSTPEVTIIKLKSK